jgi:hypothetical protein
MIAIATLHNVGKLPNKRPNKRGVLPSGTVIVRLGDGIRSLP